MSRKKYSRVIVKKLTETIEAATDPMVIIEAANALAKYVPRPKQPKRRQATPIPQKKEEVTMNMLVAAMEKGRKGQSLSAEELKMVEAVERQRKARNSLNGGSAEVA